jgi:tetratricopeptide (TPR) repeat protein
VIKEGKMLWLLSFFTGFISILGSGLLFFFLVEGSNLPLWPFAILLLLIILLDFFLIPLRCEYYYKKGMVNYSIIKLQWFLLLVPFKTLRVKAIGNVAWMLQDLGRYHESGILLARAGDVLNNSPRSYEVALSRYLINEDSQSRVSMMLAETSLNRGSYARGWLVRGISMLKRGEIKTALRSLENCRKSAMEKEDYILNGTAYYYLGLAWKLKGETDYAKDQLLKAEVLLDSLPLGFAANKQIQSI